MIAFYISGHGFGHASRDIEVLNALGRLAPHAPVAVRTSAPKWLFDLTLTRPVDFYTRECDTGVVQIDSLSLDEAETVRRASAFHDRLDALAADEADWLASIDARLVVGDIPPLACAAAHAAGVPAIAMGNFTWDWIYEGYRKWLAPGSDLIEKLGAAYALADTALRLPMHGGFATMREVVDLPFIARRSTRAPVDTRAQLGLPTDQRLALLSFGGYGLQRIDLGAVAGLTGYTIVVTADVTANRRANEVPSDAGGSAFRPTCSWSTSRRSTPEACGTKISSRQSSRAHQARLRHHRRVRGQRHCNRLHLTRALRRVQRAGARDAAVAAVRVHLKRRPAGGTLAADAGSGAGPARAT